MTPLVTARQMRALEADYEAAGGSLDELGDRAARAVYEQLRARLGSGGSALVLAGPGNNGLDAVKVHRLIQAGGGTAALHCYRRPECPPLPDLAAAAAQCAVMVDGLFGTGLSRELDEEARSFVGMINAVRDRSDPLWVVAVDVPSGLDATTGRSLGAVVQADETVTLGLPKRGLYTAEGPAFAGRVTCASLGVDWTPDSPDTFALNSSAAPALPARRTGSHKNQNGRVLVVGGSLEYPGALVLAAQSAQRAGAGYVTAAFPRSLYPAVTAHLLEQTAYPLGEAEPGALGTASIDELGVKAEQYDAVVIGNGLGRHEETAAAVHRLLGLSAGTQGAVLGFGARGSRQSESRRFRLAGLVVDGDGLYALAAAGKWWGLLPERALLTPHPGEMARLLGVTVDEVEADRLELARSAARDWSTAVLLKGAYPIAASPDGTVRVLAESHPELATAGTGDVLAGLCGRLLASGLTPVRAAEAALLIGARAATEAAARVGRDAVTASDLIAAIPAGSGSAARD